MPADGQDSRTSASTAWRYASRDLKPAISPGFPNPDAHPAARDRKWQAGLRRINVDIGYN